MPEPTPEPEILPVNLGEYEQEMIAMVTAYQMMALVHARSGCRYATERIKTEGAAKCYQEMVAPFQFLRKCLATADTVVMTLLLTGDPAHLKCIEEALEAAFDCDSAVEFAEATDKLGEAVNQANAGYYSDKRHQVEQGQAQRLSRN